jgi:hypothetical protein
MTPYHHFSLGSQVGYITFLFGFHLFSCHHPNRCTLSYSIVHIT